jgi:hypothetical protein
MGILVDDVGGQGRLSGMMGAASTNDLNGKWYFGKSIEQ